MSRETKLQEDQQAAVQQLTSLYGLDDVTANKIWKSYHPEYVYNSKKYQIRQLQFGMAIAFIAILSVVFAKIVLLTVLLQMVVYAAMSVCFIECVCYRSLDINDVSKVLEQRANASDVNTFTYNLVRDPTNEKLLRRIFYYRYSPVVTTLLLWRVIAFVTTVGVLCFTAPMFMTMLYVVANIARIFIQRSAQEHVAFMLRSMQQSYQYREEVYDPSYYFSRWNLLECPTHRTFFYWKIWVWH